MPYRVMQPWGPDRARQATVVSEHRTAAAAFRAIERLAEELARSGAQLEQFELIVVDAEGRILARPGVH